MVVPPPTEKPLRRRARPHAHRPATAPLGAPSAPADAGSPHPARPGTTGPDSPAAEGAGGRSPRLAVMLTVVAVAALGAGALAWAGGGSPASTAASSGPEASTAASSGPEASTAPAGPAVAPSSPVSTSTVSASTSVVPGSVVTVSASQSTVIVAGAVPSQAIAEELVGRAGAVYTPDQVQNQLAADPATRSPIVVVVNGATTDPALFNRLTSAFTGIVGIDTIELAGLRLDEPSELEGALMGLPSIEFVPATADIVPESLPVLDRMTDLLAAAPGTAIEIGVHTDTRGSAEANRALSQARADAVLAALLERGVANPMAARGFGESRPAVVPDDTPLTQEVNRRVELRVL
ncbi:MAG: OmpA family protein [Acidimicrobiales bacterium]